MLGSELVLSAVRAQGTDHCFMVPGGLDDPFMDPMTSTEGLRTIVAAFEGGAAYMADGYARASGRLGLCFGIGGPGVLNMATALAAARADRSSVLAVSGEVATSWEGLGGFQDASGAALDDLDAIRPLTGASMSVESPGLLPHHLRQVMTAALVDHVPAHLSIPVDVQRARVDVDWHPLPGHLVRPRHVDDDGLAAALRALDGPSAARNVVVLAGEGIRGHDGREQLRRCCERFGLPVATTLGGKGLISEDHPLALGVFGYGGSRWATEAILSDEVEVLLVVGSGLSQRDTLQWDPAMLPSRALIHVAADPTDIGRTWPADVPVVADPGAALARLTDLTGPVADALLEGRPTRTAFLEAVRSQPRRYAEEDTTSDATPMHPARVVTELRGALPDDGVLCVDSGAHRAWFAEYWTVREPGTHLSLTNLAPMGGAIPLGIGAKLARPERPLMVATGDGCMLMHGMELHTAARERVPMVVALMDNRAYGNIWYRAHDMGDGPSHLTDIPGIDWVAFARSMGADGERVEHPDGIAPAVQRALAADGPFLLDLVIDKRYPTPITPWRDAVAHWEDDH
jgi:acetolactate synthase-1/2/3 large subunit